MRYKFRSLLCIVGSVGLFDLPCSTKKDYYQENKVFFSQGVKEIRNYYSDSTDQKAAEKFLNKHSSSIFDQKSDNV